MANMADVDMDALASALFTDPNFGNDINGGNVNENNKAVQQKYNELTGKAEPVQQTGGSQWDEWFQDDEDESDEFYNKPVSFDDIRDDNDPNDDTSDLTGERSNNTEESEEFEYLDPSDFFQRVHDDEVVFNGMTAKQLKDLAVSSEQSSQEHNFIKHHFDQLSNINGTSKAIIGKNMLETQKRLQRIEAALNHPGTLASQKGVLYDDLQKERMKMAEIERDWQQEEYASQQRERAATEYGFFNTDKEMAQRKGREWDGNRLWNYVVRDMKMPVASLEAIMRTPGGGTALAELAMKSLNDDIRSKRQDKAAKAIMTNKQAPKSVSNNKGKAPVDENAQSRKAYLARKEKKVGLTPAERREQFNYLVD